MFVERGSTFQVLCGCTLAAASLALQIQLKPYVHWQSNLLKAMVDTQIFTTFLVSFILEVAAESTDASRIHYKYYQPFLDKLKELHHNYNTKKVEGLNKFFTHVLPKDKTYEMS